MAQFKSQLKAVEIRGVEPSYEGNVSAINQFTKGTLNKRCTNCCSKPLITESATINTATPNKIPTVEALAIKLTNAFFRLYGQNTL